MNEEASLIDELIAKGENQAVEFKRSDILSHPTEIAREMTALANSIGGRLLIGVCDDGTLEGMTAKKGHEEHIMSIARDKCDPPLAPKFSLMKKSGGDVYIVRILRYHTFPHAVKTKEGRVYFVRVGSTVRGVAPSELALLFESAREEIIKKPKLQLLLVDNNGNSTDKINAQPTYTKIKKVKSKIPLPDLPTAIDPFLAFGKRKPSPDLVPIGIDVSNDGEAPAHGIRISLRFPDDCELIPEILAIESLPFSVSLEPSYKPTSGGLFVEREQNEARAWIETLGNDVTMRKFEKVYVRFPAEQQEHKITAYITQHNFPLETFEFTVNVKPRFVEKKEYVYGDRSNHESNISF